MGIKIRKVKNQEDFEDKIPLKLGIDTLNIILGYIISDSDTISRGSLTNVRKLFNMIDDRLYESDYESIARFKFIKRALSAKLDNYMENPMVILESCRSNKYADVDDEIIEDISEMKLKANDIKYVTSMISDKLTYSFFYKYKDAIYMLLDKMDKGEYESFKHLKKEMKKEITGLLTDIRRVESLESSQEMFSLTDDLFESVVAKTVKKLQSESNVLLSNMQMMNECLNGGFESKRIYTIMAVSGGFKSGTLLNIAYQIKQANLRYKTRDPLKRPAILFITQENTVEESVDRLFSLCVSDDVNDRMKDYNVKDAIKLLKTKGKLKITKDNNIDIIIQYKAPGSINTADIYNIIDELEEEGQEIVCLIHDYIKKLKSVNPTKDLRIDLGFIVDELKALAVQYDIPVITATQLNREAAKVIDAGIECNKSDLARMLGIANVGESWSIIENSDWVGIVNRERQIQEDRMYLTIKRLKIRYGNSSSIDYFNQPFKANEFGLVEDVGADCAARKYLSQGLIGVQEDDVIKFEKRGHTGSKTRENKDEKKGYSLSELDSIFNKAS